MPQGLAVGYNTLIPYGLAVIPMFLGVYPKGIPFLFKFKKEKVKLKIGLSEGKGT